MHPTVIKKYQDAGLDIYERASDANEAAFWDQVKTSGKPVKKEITKIVRLRKGKEEKFYYHEELKSRDHLGNKIHCYHVVGTYKDPEFTTRVDAKTGKAVITEVEEETEVYEYKWPEQWTNELEELITETVDLLVVTPSRKYGGFSFEDFKEQSFDNLVTLGKYGTLNPVQIESIKQKKAIAK